MKWISVCVALILLFGFSSQNVIAQSLTGTTGLVTIPTAEMPEDGEISFGFSIINKEHSAYSYAHGGQHHEVANFITLGYLPFLEITPRLTRLLHFPQPQAIGDRMVSIRLRVLKESAIFPSVVCGVHDPFGASINFSASYLVASKSFSASNCRMGIHLGYGGDWLKAREAKGHQFLGLFGGVSLSPSPFITLMLEHDAEKLNGGVRLSIFDRLELTGAFLGFDAFSGGISYKRPLHGQDKVASADEWPFQVDVLFHPQFKAQFGNFDDPIGVESQVNLAPEVRAALWKGMTVSGQLIIPLQNELEEEGNHWRPGLLTVSQFLRLPRDTFASATLGYFTRHRYGGDLEVRKYFANRRCAIGANLGYTGYALYREGIWYYSGVDLLTTFLNAGYWFPRFDLTLTATYGKFLYGDKGWRFDILRRFGEVDIGFFALTTETGSNGGFNFSIPFPRKSLSVGPVRIGPAKEFPWEYRYKGLPNNGIRYKTGSSVDELERR